MNDHPSNPDQLMAHTLGVCWHSPGLSAMWPCTPLADWEIELLRPCGACACTEASHGATEGDSGCRTPDCECDAFEGPEAPYEEPPANDLYLLAARGSDCDPIECNYEAALGEAEEKLRQARNVIAEFEARAEAAKYASTMTAEDEPHAMIEWGRYYGYAHAAKFLREAIQ